MKRLWILLFGVWQVKYEGYATIPMRSVFRGDFEEVQYVRVEQNSRSGKLRAWRKDPDQGKVPLAPWAAQYFLDAQAK